MKKSHIKRARKAKHALPLKVRLAERAKSRLTWKRAMLAAKQRAANDVAEAMAGRADAHKAKMRSISGANVWSYRDLNKPERLAATHAATDARIAMIKSLVGRVTSRTVQYGTIARQNRHTGKPHEHAREIARRQRQQGA